jgi:hypothetical protein
MHHRLGELPYPRLCFVLAVNDVSSLLDLCWSLTRVASGSSPKAPRPGHGPGRGVRGESSPGPGLSGNAPPLRVVESVGLDEANTMSRSKRVSWVSHMRFLLSSPRRASLHGGSWRRRWGGSELPVAPSKGVGGATGTERDYRLRCAKRCRGVRGFRLEAHTSSAMSRMFAQSLLSADSSAWSRGRPCRQIVDIRLWSLVPTQDTGSPTPRSHLSVGAIDT